MTFAIVASDQLSRVWRERYLATLPEPQVHYLEQRVAAARAFHILDAVGAIAGYAAVHDGAVVELFVTDAMLPWLSEVLFASAEAGGARSIVIKTYDALALAAAAGRPARVETIGVMCTRWSDERFDPPPGFTSRRGTAEDRAVLLAVGPGLFETPGEIEAHLAAGHATIYALQGEPVGCGLLTPVYPKGAVFDIGVGVLPAWRRRGMGEHIVRHLRAICLRDLRGRPTCGCAVDNLASRRTLEKAGFLTRHRLLEFTWEPSAG